MNILDIILIIVGGVSIISICIYFFITSVKSEVFQRLGFVDNKEELYKVTFKKYDFDYKIVSGKDNNENEENKIREAIKNINTNETYDLKEVDYYQ